MRKILTLFIVAGLIFSCATAKKYPTTATNQTTSSNNDGSSFEKAIVIQEKSESAGVAAEYTWLKEKYPGYQSKGQSLTMNGKKPYDIIQIMTANEEEKKIYFDISNYFGKF